jgi:hypothetical protein
MVKSRREILNKEMTYSTELMTGRNFLYGIPQNNKDAQITNIITWGTSRSLDNSNSK